MRSKYRLKKLLGTSSLALVRNFNKILFYFAQIEEPTDFNYDKRKLITITRAATPKQQSRKYLSDSYRYLTALWKKLKGLLKPYLNLGNFINFKN